MRYDVEFAPAAGLAFLEVFAPGADTPTIVDVPQGTGLTAFVALLDEQGLAK
jgi:hypothetical protein